MEKTSRSLKSLHRALMLLGSNLGDRMQTLNSALAMIGKEIGEITVGSSIYETEPWGKKDQPAFLNQVIEVFTDLAPLELLEKTQEIEKKAGRIRFEHWGPRILDIDILYFDDQIVVKDMLKIPHPEIANRKFTLVPLVEIAPDLIHPVLNISNKQMLERNTDALEVKRYTFPEQGSR